MQIKDHDLKFKEVEIHCNYNVEKASKQHPVSHGFSVLMSILNNVNPIWIIWIYIMKIETTI